MDFTHQTGRDIIEYIQENYKYKIIIKSKPYNFNGAYWPLENTYIYPGDNIYISLTKDTPIKTQYVDYYNNMKADCEKKTFNMPVAITEDNIDSICIYKLSPNYSEYYM